MAEKFDLNVMQDLSNNAGFVQVQRPRTISIPSPDSDREMAIRCADWKMLEKRLTATSNPPKNYSTLYGTLFGLSGSAVLSLIPLANTKDLPAWVLPSYGAFAFTCAFCGIFTFFLTRGQQKIYKTTITDLLDYVKEIGSRFAPRLIQDDENTSMVEPFQKTSNE